MQVLALSCLAMLAVAGAAAGPSRPTGKSVASGVGMRLRGGASRDEDLVLADAGRAAEIELLDPAAGRQAGGVRPPVSARKRPVASLEDEDEEDGTLLPPGTPGPSDEPVILTEAETIEEWPFGAGLERLRHPKGCSAATSLVQPTGAGGPHSNMPAARSGAERGGDEGARCGAGYSDLESDDLDLELLAGLRPVTHELRGRTCASWNPSYLEPDSNPEQDSNPPDESRGRARGWDGAGARRGGQFAGGGGWGEGGGESRESGRGAGGEIG